MSGVPKTNEQLLSELVQELAQSAHNVAKVAEVRNLLEKNFSGTKSRLIFLSPFLTREAVGWAEVKQTIWDTEEKQNKNEYCFLQGDIVETTLARGIGFKVLDEDPNNIWLVLSPDCDCVRGSYIKLAPIFFVKNDTEDYATNKANLSAAGRFSSPKYFPLGIDLFEDGSEGCYADFTEPYFLRNEDKKSAAVHYTLKSEGWHLLNGIIKESETRANLDEGEKIRKFRL